MRQRADLATSTVVNCSKRVVPCRCISLCRWMAGFVTVLLLMFTLAGCSNTDLSGYRPLEKNAASDNDAESMTVKGDRTSDQEPSNLPDQLLNAAEPVATVDGSLSVSALAPVNVVDGANVSSLLKVAPSEAASNADSSAMIKPVDSAVSKNAQPSAVATPLKVELLIPEKTFRTDATSKALRVSFDDLDLLKVLNMEPVRADAVDQMPLWLKELNGQRIKIRGFMYPTFETEGIERFVLARDNQICCFGRDPKVYDLVQVDMRAGKTTNYIPATRAFDVVGRLKIEMVSEDEKPFGLYFLEDAEVIDR